MNKCCKYLKPYPCEVTAYRNIDSMYEKAIAFLKMELVPSLCSEAYSFVSKEPAP